jgi:ABC-type uncharacterized transport system YnjBCD substrate-binding protein
MTAIVDPHQADAVMVGEGHAPLWQYLSRLQRQATRAHLRTQRRRPLRL